MTEETKTPEGNVEVPKDDEEKGTKTPAAKSSGGAYSGPEPDPLPQAKIVLCVIGAILFFSMLAFFYGKLANDGGAVAPSPDMTSMTDDMIMDTNMTNGTMAPSMNMTDDKNMTGMDMTDMTNVTMDMTNVTMDMTNVTMDMTNVTMDMTNVTMPVINGTDAPVANGNETAAPVATDAPTDATEAPEPVATDAPTNATEAPEPVATDAPTNATEA